MRSTLCKVKLRMPTCCTQRLNSFVQHKWQSSSDGKKVKEHVTVNQPNASNVNLSMINFCGESGEAVDWDHYRCSICSIAVQDLPHLLKHLTTPQHVQSIINNLNTNRTIKNNLLTNVNEICDTLKSNMINHENMGHLVRRLRSKNNKPACVNVSKMIEKENNNNIDINDINDTKNSITTTIENEQHQLFLSKIKQTITHECKDLASIKNILNNNTTDNKKNNKNDNYIKDISVYTCAIQKLSHLRLWNDCIEISKMAFRSNIIRDEFFYGALFNVYARNDQINKAYPRLYNHMTKQDKIVPNIVMMTTLVKGCIKNGLFSTAMEILKETNEYEIETDESFYCVLIAVCGKAGEISTAEMIFDQYLQLVKIKPDQYKPNRVIFNAIFKVLKDCGKIDKLIEYKQLAILKYCDYVQFETIDYTTFMSAYLKAKQPEKAMKMYQEMIDKGFEPDFLALAVLQSIHIQLMIKTKLHDENERLKHLNIVTTEIPRKHITSGSKIDTRCVLNILRAMLLYHGQKQWSIVAKQGKKFIKSGHFNYWQQSKRKKGLIPNIDLHQFSVVEAIFLLRYIFMYEKDIILEHVKHSSSLMIVTGRKLYGKIKQSDLIDKDKDAPPLKDAIAYELLNWQPELVGIPSKMYGGCIELDSTSIFDFYDNCGTLDDKFLNCTTDTLQKYCVDTITMSKCT